jgi:hypothetical protein
LHAYPIAQAFLEIRYKLYTSVRDNFIREAFLALYVFNKGLNNFLYL